MSDIVSQPNDSTEVSLRKAVELLGQIETKTGAAEITGEVTVSNTVPSTTESLEYLKEAIVTANELSDAAITDIANFNLTDSMDLVGAIVVFPYFPHGSMSGTVRFMVSGSIGTSNFSGKLANGTTPSYISSVSISEYGALPTLFFPPNAKYITIKKVNEQGAPSAAGISSTQDIVFRVYRAPSVNYYDPPYSLTIASETKNAVGDLLSTITSLVSPGASTLRVKLEGVSDGTFGSYGNGNSIHGDLQSVSGYSPAFWLRDEGGNVPVSGTVTVEASRGAATKTRGTTSASPNTSAAAPAPLNATQASRKYLLIQNISDTDMYVNFGAAATTNDLLVPKNGGGIVFESGFVPTDSVNVICSAASKKYFILSA